MKWPKEQTTHETFSEAVFRKKRKFNEVVCVLLHIEGLSRLCQRHQTKEQNKKESTDKLGAVR